MKFLHLSDLHIGKIVNDFSMLEDQKFILDQIIRLAQTRKADAVLLAGDIYDRAIPSGEAVLLLDNFLTALAESGIKVYMISGNHDSAERISFGEAVFAKEDIYIGGVYKGALPVFFQKDEWGEVEFVLLPFMKPAQADTSTSQEAVAKLLEAYEKERIAAKREGRRVLITHYFITDAGREPELSDSETTVHVGGLDQVDAGLFQGFDYVALGHIHKRQQIGEKPVYYAGSPLKYSFGETLQTKSVYWVELDEKGLAKVEMCPLRPMREMRKVKGSLNEIMENALSEGPARDDYIQAILTDKEELIDPMGTLRSVYPNIMQIVKEDFEPEVRDGVTRKMIQKKEPLVLFEEFFQLVRGEAMSEEERKVMEQIVREL